ncbi:MAG: PQQ-dependent sugar dehydrogenase [Planctomycetes bacterium]|nr:PQQ-dependent sugar dehydrogenase [Planctomycetota bacterium]
MLRSVSIAAVAVAAFASTSFAQTVPTGFVIDTVIASGLAAPMDFCFLADGRVLVANRAGAVSIWNGSSLATVGTVPNIESGGERGLLSIAADPNFATNGHIYVYGSLSTDSFMHLDRFTCTGDLSNPNSTNVTFAQSTRRVILAAIPDSAFNHNGGACRFGPDGMLYQTIGDDASSCTAQTLTSQLGCLLRMDVSTLPAGGGTTPPTFSSLDPGNNPLSANTDFSQLLVAHGLRNPFRMEIDQLTGNVYVGDVGSSGTGKVEEYNEYVYNGGGLTLVNWGWPWREGTALTGTNCGGSAPAGMVAPIGSVPTGFGWLSVMGGPRYRNQGTSFDFGPGYEGDAFFLDFFQGELRRLVNTGTWGPAPAVPGQPNATNWGTGFTAVSSLRQGPDGGLWFAQNTSTSPSSGGTLKRIRSLGPTNSVVAVSGGGQVGVAGEAYGAPIVARVRDPNGNPLPGGTVNFVVSGGATLTTVNPVIADANGLAQTTAIATATGGAATVTASTPNGQTNGTFSLFARRLAVTPASNLVVVGFTNTTTAVPAQVPTVVFASFPGGPTVPSILGPICTDPSYGLTFILEDGVGVFGGLSYSGSGGVATPSKTWIYTVPVGLLTGQLMKFQLIGFDPVTGWFRTNCESRQF